MMPKPTAADLIRFCLELDQQVIHPRPSSWGLMAELVATICDHLSPSWAEWEQLGDWRSIDLIGVREPAPQKIDRPTVDRPPPDELHLRLCGILGRIAPSGFPPEDGELSWIYHETYKLLDIRISELRERDGIY
jgi:hypothetical protein